MTIVTSAYGIVITVNKYPVCVKIYLGDATGIYYCPSGEVYR